MALHYGKVRKKTRKKRKFRKKRTRRRKSRKKITRKRKSRKRVKSKKRLGGCFGRRCPQEGTNKPKKFQCSAVEHQSRIWCAPLDHCEWVDRHNVCVPKRMRTGKHWENEELS